MWKTTVLAATVSLAMGGAFASEAAAQGKAVGRASEKFERRERESEREREREDGRWYENRDERARARGVDWDRDRDRDRNDRGPAFCRSGAGHPVHGREWCRDKGFGLGDGQWSRAGWEDVVFGRRDRRYDRERMSESVLERVLGRGTFGRLESQSRRVGSGPLWGQWYTPSGGPRILQVFVGPRPLAEFYDRNRDGRSDVILLNLGRR